MLTERLRVTCRRVCMRNARLTLARRVHRRPSGTTAQRAKLKRASEVAESRERVLLSSAEPSRTLRHVGYYHTCMLPRIIQAGYR